MMNTDALLQDQFLDVIDRDEAERRFHAALDLRPLEVEEVPLAAAFGRILAEDVRAPIDVPGFDRSNVDGFALRAEDTYGATEEQPRSLRLNYEMLATGVEPKLAVQPETATPIATGAVVPRGADAVVMIEHTDVDRLPSASCLIVRRPVAPGENVTFAGTDIGRGETVLRRGEVLTSRETGVLAALGLGGIPVVRRPRIAIISTGDELAKPGATLKPGQIYDSNATVLADAVRELGAEPVSFGIVPDELSQLNDRIRDALKCDAVLLSGGTSKGAGDLSHRVVSELGPPGILVHGVALKPGKPLCLAVVNMSDRRPVPVVVLPGFPTSAIFTFHEFVTPVIERMAGRRTESREVVQARLPQRINSERGRTEYLLVSLMDRPANDGKSREFAAYPMGKGSGSVTAFGRADGFIVIPRQREYLEADEKVDVHLLSRSVRPADLVVIGSHCVGLDRLLGRLQERGYRSKFLAVGSSGGLAAARRGECDLAGIHLLDPATDTYNAPFVTDDLVLIPGYYRLQGIVFRPGDRRFENCSVDEAMSNALADPECVMVNRNRGSGTRVLIDRLLGDRRPPGYWIEAKSHNAVAAAVSQGRADWGVAIKPVAENLGFISLQNERYDFVVPKTRMGRPAVREFIRLLNDPTVRAALSRLGFSAPS